MSFVQGKKENETQEELKENHKKMTLSMIYQYLQYGYTLERIEQYAETEGYTIDEEDMETVKNIQKGEIKVATEQFIYNIITRIDLSYEELSRMGKSEGYVILKSRYDNAKKQVERSKKREKGEERE